MKNKQPLAVAGAIAYALVKELAPFCERIEVAGSVRRRQAVVGDLELVCIPKPVLDLFGEPMERTEVDWWLDDQVPQGDISKNGQRYKQFMWHGVQIDLFLVTPDNWGYIFMLRTGPAEFSKRMVTLTTWGGFKPADIRVDDGQVWRAGQPIPVPDEETLFRLWGMDFIAPEQRIAEAVAT